MLHTRELGAWLSLVSMDRDTGMNEPTGGRVDSTGVDGVNWTKSQGQAGGGQNRFTIDTLGDLRSGLVVSTTGTRLTSLLE
jgi:hypothetical protein